MQIILDDSLSGVVPNAISFETGASRAQTGDSSLYVYEHHGEEFGWADPGALTSFFDDLIQGRPMPPVFATKGIRDVDTLVAIVLASNRRFIDMPATAAFVAATDLVHRRGIIGHAHVDPELSRLLKFLRTQFPNGLVQSEIDSRLENCVDFIKDYIETGQLPHLGQEPPEPWLIDAGSQGFVVAETKGSFEDGWESLFRRGYLRGALFGPVIDGRQNVLIGRKGPHVPFRLEMAAKILNEMETAMGELPGWKTNGLWLYPEDGTTILSSHLIQVLVRV
jgi:hypothetical protein